MDGLERPYLDPPDMNERDIELPFGFEALSRAEGRVLEVGNTSQRSYPDLPLRDIVCRYDELGGRYPVYHEDIISWDAGVRYDLIVSLSTLEHVGHDYDEVMDNGKAIRAVVHCMQLLVPGGEFVFTIPCAFHGSLEFWLVDRPWEQMAMMERVSTENEWVQRPVAEHTPSYYPSKWGAAQKVLFFRYIRPLDGSLT